MSRLPPLPEPANEAQTDECTYACPEGYTADQLRERDRQIVEMCAQRCRELGNEHGEHHEWAQTCSDAILELLKGSA